MKRPVIDIEALRKAHEETQKSLQNLAKQAPVKEGQLYVHGWFKSFTVWVSDGGPKKTKLETPNVPDPKMVPKKDGNGSFPASLNLNVQLKELTEIKDNCVPDGDGWRVLVTVTYTPEAERYLRDYREAFYKGEMVSSRFPIGDFISEQGELKTKYWRKFNNKDNIEMVVYDNENNIFRALNEDGTPKVDPYTEIRFGNCLAQSKIIMVEDYAQKDVLLRKKVPGESISFSCKGQATISVNNDPHFTGTERIHHLNDLDAHTLIPFANLVKGDTLPNSTSFEYVADGYQTPESSNKEYGVLVFTVDPKESDLKRQYMKQVTYLDNVCWTKFQYDTGTTEQDKKRYYYCIANASKGEWKQWGITHPEAYVAIRAASKLPLMLQVNWSIKDIMHDDSNLKGIENINGIYRGYVREYDVDFIRGLPSVTLGGIKISKARVEQEFSKWKGRRDYDNTTTLTLSAKDVNPLHGKGLNSPILSLGNGKTDVTNPKNISPLYHAFQGDIYPILDQCDFYVLVSHVLTPEERKLHCGESGTNGDAFLDGLIKGIGPDLQYWIYAYNKPCIPKRATSSSSGGGEGSKKIKVEEVEHAILPVAVPPNGEDDVEEDEEEE